MSESENESKQSSEQMSNNEEEERDLEKLPEELEQVLTPQLSKVLQATLSMQRFSSSSSISPILSKINEKHISQILDTVGKDDERVFADTQSARTYNLITLIVVLIFFGGLTVFLVNKDVAVYQEILKIIIIFGGGFGSGIGFKGYLDRKNK